MSAGIDNKEQKATSLHQAIRALESRVHFNRRTGGIIGVALSFDEADAVLTVLAQGPSLTAENCRLREALEWYERQTSGVLGNDGMEALEADQGKRARAALSAPEQPKYNQ